MNPAFAPGAAGNAVSFTGRGPGPAAAADWETFNNTTGTTTTELLQSSDGTSVLHVETDGVGNGVVNVFSPPGTGPMQGVSLAWLFVVRGQVGIGAADGGSTGFDTVSRMTGAWEVVTGIHSGSPANEFIAYASSVGGAEFYIYDPHVLAVDLAGGSPPAGSALTAGDGCNGVFSGTFTGNVGVSSGQNCVFVGGTINGNVRQQGGNLLLAGDVVCGDVDIQDGSFAIGPMTAINGSLQVHGVPSGTAPSRLSGGGKTTAGSPAVGVPVSDASLRAACNQPPIARCQKATAIADAQCQATASIDNGSSDPNDDAVTLRQSPAGPYRLGTTPVTLTASDASGASAQCTASVSVVDTTPPAISCPLPQTVECTGLAGGRATLGTPTATDNCSVAGIACAPSSGTFPLGLTPVTCTAKDGSNNMSTCTTSVTVVDTKPPSISCPAPRTLECTSNRSATATVTAAAFDACDGAVTASCTTAAGPAYPVGTTVVACSARDRAGNTGRCSTAVTVVDTTPPVVTCPKPRVVECTSPSGAAASVTATASDQCDGTVPVSCAVPGSYRLGTTPVSCHAADRAGNTGSCSTTVTVVDTTPPTIRSVRASPNLLWPPNHAMVPVVISVDVADACDATVANRCAIVSVSSNEPVDAAGDGKTSPDWQFRGLLLSLRAERSGAGQGRVYTVGIRCADAAGNAATKSVTVTVPHNH